MGNNRFLDPISEQLGEFIAGVGVGNRLPSERDMAARLKVSRTALRDRLRMLEVLGLLERLQGSGTYVQPLDPTGLAFAFQVMLSCSHLGLEDLHSVRRALERQAAVEATLRGGLDTREIRKCLGVMAMSTDMEEVVKADTAFHLELLALSGNPALKFFADSLQGVLAQSLRHRQDQWRQAGLGKDELVQVHSRIVYAVEGGDAANAGQAVEEHFIAFDVKAARGDERQ